MLVMFLLTQAQFVASKGGHLCGGYVQSLGAENLMKLFVP